MMRPDWPSSYKRLINHPPYIVLPLSPNQNHSICIYKFSRDVYIANALLVRTFVIIFLQSPLLPEDFVNCVGYHFTNHTATSTCVELYCVNTIAK